MNSTGSSTAEILKESHNKWVNNIVGHADVDPRVLKKHIKNPRIHSERQRRLMREMLDEVGWLDEIKVNLVTGNMLNGHMRLDEAIENGESTVPVSYVKVAKEKEAKVLAIYDRMVGWADYDQESTDELLAEIEESSGMMEEILTEMDSANTLDEEYTLKDIEDPSLEDEKEDENSFEEADGFSDMPPQINRAITIFPTESQYPGVLSALDYLGNHFKTKNSGTTVIRALFWAAEELGLEIGAPSTTKRNRKR